MAIQNLVAEAVVSALKDEFFWEMGEGKIFCFEYLKEGGLVIHYICIATILISLCAF